MKPEGQRDDLGSMPRFYFHLHNDLDVPDDEGTDLPDLEAAREYAACNARMIMGQTIKDEGRISLKHHIDIEDEEGTVLATVRFKEAATIVT